MRSPGLVRPLVTIGIASILAILGGATITTYQVAAQTEAQPELAASDMSLDEQMLAVAKRDPSFGGMFLDDDGRLSMYVLEASLAANDGFNRLATTTVAVQSAFRDDDRIADAVASKRINVLPAQFSFADLYAWNEALKTDVLTLPGVALTDIAEDLNRVRVGVETVEMENQVRARLDPLGIPGDAVVVEVTGGFRQMATLRSKIRPFTGGLQINFGGFVCTIGFPAIRAGIPGFVTNSHCTAIQGGVQNTIYHQPLASGTTNRLGLEIRDPNYFVGGVCPAGRRCRYSDTAFARVPHPAGPPNVVQLGYISRTTGLGSLTISTTLPRWRIVSENSVPFLNEVLNKVGRTTGWSQGTVRFTCATVNVSGTNITQICQDIVRARVAGGDSGSPVFRIVSGSGSTARLYGILWGGGTISGATHFVFSAFGTRNVQRASEMGGLRTCASPATC